MTQRHGQVILLTVTEFARICGTTARTIRFYEKNGLITPARIDSFNKYRYYRPEQAKEIFKIKLLQSFQLPLQTIQTLLQTSRIEEVIKEKVNQLHKEFLEKQKELIFLKEMSSVLTDDISFKKKVKREAIGPYQLFCLTVFKGDYNKIDEYIAEARKTAKGLGLVVSKSEITFYHDYQYKPKASRIEIALILKEAPKQNFLLTHNYCIKKFPKTKVLSFDFRGPYTYLSLIHERMDVYVEGEKIAVKWPVFEHYLKNPLHSASSFNYVTKICYPI